MLTCFIWLSFRLPSFHLSIVRTLKMNPFNLLDSALRFSVHRCKYGIRAYSSALITCIFMDARTQNSCIGNESCAQQMKKMHSQLLLSLHYLKAKPFVRLHKMGMHVRRHHGLFVFRHHTVCIWFLLIRLDFLPLVEREKWARFLRWPPHKYFGSKLNIVKVKKAKKKKISTKTHAVTHSKYTVNCGHFPQMYDCCVFPGCVFFSVSYSVFVWYVVARLMYEK